MDSTEKTPATKAIEAQSSPEIESPLQDKGQTALVPQSHGGALKRGDNAGNRGNVGGMGRPKESYRRRMRRLLGRSVALLERELLAAMARANGERVAPVLAGQTPHGPVLGAPMTRDELVKIVTVLGKYGLGTEDKKQVEETTVRYVIRIPQRVQTRPAGLIGPIAVVTASDAETDVLAGPDVELEQD